MKSYGLNNLISNTELWALMFVFMVASSMSLPIGYTSEHDSWISAIIGSLAGLFIAWIYVTLCGKFPQKSVIHIAKTLFGTWIGTAIGILYTGYGFQLGAYVLRNFEDLTVTVLLPRTPSVVIGLIMITISAWAAYQGIEVICRCALLLMLIVVLQIVSFTLLLIPEMDPSLLLPVFESDWGSVLDGAAQISTSPLGETVLFIMIIPFINRPEKVKKTVLTVIGIAGIVLISTHFFNVMVMGELSSTQIFPAYTTVMYISVGDFFERIEPLVYIVWVFGEFMMLSVCLYAAALALAQTVGSRDYRIFIVPLGLALLELTLFLHPNQLDVIEFQKHFWPWVSLPFQVVIPLVLLLFSLIKRKSKSDSLE
ncbi:endospore germination permease [Paenibacillus sp. OV219]|uniref:GerAB/ArcD/ProY family transporter n=1 Tax=Paenibacillus sp. OV219 TaxID=1884377 RepID=UPI0008AEAC5B|nr:endospore germination permease [Paenibacillus sp. OV219]SEO00654.1 spore germination protein KB [Paenibacillus sp. OV219]